MLQSVKTSIARKSIILVLLASMLLGLFAPVTASAASTATKKFGYTPIKATSILPGVSVSGTDTFNITYNKSNFNIIRISTSQSSKTYGTGMIKPAGIRLIKKTAKTWTYQADWDICFNVLPSWMKALGKRLHIKWVNLSRVGRIATIHVQYNVSVLRSTGRQTSYEWRASKELYSSLRDFFLSFIH